MVLIVGIDTSCDDTSVGVVEYKNGKLPKILSNVRYSQNEIHKHFGGVVPEYAARAHLEFIDKVWNEALEKAGITEKDIDYIVVTNEPGLVGSLVVGLTFAKAKALRLEKKFFISNHILSHISASFSVIFPPFLSLVISGGHTELFFVDKDFKFEILSYTIDDAAGECIDKVGRFLGYEFPYAVYLDSDALSLLKKGNIKKNPLKLPLIKENKHLFSFSGLKTASINLFEKGEEREKVSFFLMEKIAEKIKLEIDYFKNKKKIDNVVITGGVAASKFLRNYLIGDNIYYPQFSLCTDNGAMVALSLIPFLNGANNFAREDLLLLSEAFSLSYWERE